MSSAFYFEKAAVTAAGMSSAASRTALFAAINGASAAIVGTVQVGRTNSFTNPPACAAVHCCILNISTVWSASWTAAHCSDAV